MQTFSTGDFDPQSRLDWLNFWHVIEVSNQIKSNLFVYGSLSSRSVHAILQVQQL